MNLFLVMDILVTLLRMGFKVIHEPIDFYNNTHLGDCIIKPTIRRRIKDAKDINRHRQTIHTASMPKEKKVREYYKQLFPYPDAPMVTLSHPLLSKPKFTQANIVMDNIRETTPAACLFYCYNEISF